MAAITSVLTWAGFLSRAVMVVLEFHSQRVVGWAIDDHLRGEPISDADNMAIW